MDTWLLLYSPASLSACLPACLVDCFNRLAFPLSVSLQQFGTGYRLRLQRRWLRLPRLLLLLLLGKTQISSMSCGLGAGAGSVVDWAAVLLQNRYNFVVIYSDASFQHVLQRLLHSYIKLHIHTLTQAQIDTILQAHVLHRFVRYAIVIAPRRVEFCSVLFLLVRFSVQFNFFYIFQFQVRCLSLLACSFCCCCYCFFILRLEEGLEQLRLIDFFWVLQYLLFLTADAGRSNSIIPLKRWTEFFYGFKLRNLTQKKSRSIGNSKRWQRPSNTKQ